MGLWGKNYTIDGPTEIHYALIPHAGKWDRAGTWAESTKWNEPLIVSAGKTTAKPANSLIKITDSNVEVTSVQFNGNDMLVRLFNAGTSKSINVTFNCNADKATLVELDGRERQVLQLIKTTSKQNTVSIAIPRFGIRTIRLINAR
jgi:alpha-mannosidase